MVSLLKKKWVYNDKFGKGFASPHREWCMLFFQMQAMP